ncbi:unnamed protein product [Vitrella brassicaformis CCMP3155]|uniref:Uncharacterized protein n=4 Tax=Vitrella brassicaformis TaxID=1169539 RepID=A0A0G4EFC1_VITBC|nr:unnamed protein product [Vitrella brassicaformis CCMP3155]|eukprot:CEL94676.1 unnamed protein product [Vitrella brassicaformis CCMP3155]
MATFLTAADLRELESAAKALPSAQRAIIADIKKRAAALISPQTTSDRAGVIEKGQASRRLTFINKFTFQPDKPSYYDDLPTRPAFGWWKGLLYGPRGLRDAEEIEQTFKRLNVPVPDTVYCTASEKFMIRNTPDVAAAKDRTPQADMSSAPLPHRLSCSVELDFNAVKVMEEEVEARFMVEARQRAAERNIDAKMAMKEFLTRPVVVMKQPKFNAPQSNSVRVLDLNTLASTEPGSECVYQAFVPPKGSRRFQLTRVAWRATKAPYGFTLVNLLSPEQTKEYGGDLTAQCTVSVDNAPLPKSGLTETFRVYPVAGSTIGQPAEIARRIFYFTQRFFKMRLEELVVDAINGERGWVFLQVKAFRVHPHWVPSGVVAAIGEEDILDEDQEQAERERQPKVLRSLDDKKVQSKCESCGIVQDKRLLRKRMNGRMMLEMLHHMRKRGLDLEILTHCDPYMSSDRLSAQLPVCQTCFSLYRAERELIEIEMRTAPFLRASDDRSSVQLHPRKDADLSDDCSLFTGVIDSIRTRSSLRDHFFFQLYDHLENTPERDLGKPEFANRIDRLKDQRGQLIKSMQQPATEQMRSRAASRMGDESKAVALPARRKSRPRLSLSKQPRHRASILASTPSSRMFARATETVRASERKQKRGTDRERKGVDQEKVQSMIRNIKGGEAVSTVAFKEGMSPSAAPLPAKLYQWRMMLFFHTIEELTADLRKRSLTSKLIIVMKLFGQTRRIPIDVLATDPTHINRLVVKYIFSKEPLFHDLFREEGLELFLVQVLPPEAVINDKDSESSRFREESDIAPGLLAASSKTGSLLVGGRLRQGQRVLAMGSLSLSRLQSVSYAKQQTYVFLFSRRYGGASLKLTLGLQKDLQVPTQYLRVSPCRDAYLPLIPYSNSLPLPSEWLDCFQAGSYAPDWTEDMDTFMALRQESTAIPSALLHDESPVGRAALDHEASKEEELFDDLPPDEARAVQELALLWKGQPTTVDTAPRGGRRTLRPLSADASQAGYSPRPNTGGGQPMALLSGYINTPLFLSARPTYTTRASRTTLRPQSATASRSSRSEIAPQDSRMAASSLSVPERSMKRQVSAPSIVRAAVPPSQRSGKRATTSPGRPVSAPAPSPPPMTLPPYLLEDIPEEQELKANNRPLSASASATGLELSRRQHPPKRMAQKPSRHPSNITSTRLPSSTRPPSAVTISGPSYRSSPLHSRPISPIPTQRSSRHPYALLPFSPKAVLPPNDPRLMAWSSWLAQQDVRRPSSAQMPTHLQIPRMSRPFTAIGGGRHSMPAVTLMPQQVPSGQGADLASSYPPIHPSYLPYFAYWMAQWQQQQQQQEQQRGGDNDGQQDGGATGDMVSGGQGETDEGPLRHQGSLRDRLRQSASIYETGSAAYMLRARQSR